MRAKNGQKGILKKWIDNRSIAETAKKEADNTEFGCEGNMAELF